MEDDLQQRVYLNVGGIMFETCRETLLCTGSSYFENRLENYTNDVALFIDRDPNYFTYILSYLRNRQLNISHDMGKMFTESLYLEACYYDLQDLQNILTKIMTEKRKTYEADIINELKQIRLSLTNHNQKKNRNVDYLTNE